MSVYQEAYHLPEFTYDYEKLKIEQRGPVYICSFNDADNLNSMSYAQMAEFNDFLIKVRMDKDCRVIVLTGEGRSFCAGFNLNDLALDPPEDMGRIQRDFYVMQRMCSDQVLNMAKCEQPIIGALKGFAVGGGLSISCACDMRVLGESYKMNAGYLSIGYTGTDMGGSFFLPKIVGYARACEILMNPNRFGAEKLLEWGFANKVVADKHRARCFTHCIQICKGDHLLMRGNLEYAVRRSIDDRFSGAHMFIPKLLNDDRAGSDAVPQSSPADFSFKL